MSPKRWDHLEEGPGDAELRDCGAAGAAGAAEQLLCHALVEVHASVRTNFRVVCGDLCGRVAWWVRLLVRTQGVGAS